MTMWDVFFVTCLKYVLMVCLFFSLVVLSFFDCNVVFLFLCFFILLKCAVVCSYYNLSYGANHAEGKSIVPKKSHWYTQIASVKNTRWEDLFEKSMLDENFVGVFISFSLVVFWSLVGITVFILFYFLLFWLALSIED